MTAVATEIDAVNLAAGTVLTSDLKEESEREGIEKYQNLTSKLIDLWVVTSGPPKEIEGPAPGENYRIYPITCLYWNVRSGDADWEKTARTQVETICDRLNQNSNVFRIGGQIQLRTEEVALVEAQGFETIEDGMLVFKAVVTLQVEARRWA